MQITEEFFKPGDDVDNDDSDDDDDDDTLEEEEYRFFFKVFTEDRELMEYYEKNYYNGDDTKRLTHPYNAQKFHNKHPSLEANGEIRGFPSFEAESRETRTWDVRLFVWL